MAKIAIMHQSVFINDAIGNDIEGMYQLLSKNHNCGVFAHKCMNQSISYLDLSQLHSWIKHPYTLIIYHHSGYWGLGEKILKASRCKIWIRYHNITPSRFFHPYSSTFGSLCEMGRMQTLRLQKAFPHAIWVCDSRYNTTDLLTISGANVEVCPPFHKVEHWNNTQPDDQVLERLMDTEAIHLLCVGRVLPHKGHFFLLEVLRIALDNHEKKKHLYIVGKKHDWLTAYNQALEAVIRDYGLDAHVHFIGEIDEAGLIAYYLGCDFFVCASDHEGFCVPLIEAQFLRLPIIAKRTSAVPETIGENQIVLNDDPRDFAVAIEVLYENNRYYSCVMEEGLKNYNTRFQISMIENRFGELLERTAGVRI